HTLGVDCERGHSRHHGRPRSIWRGEVRAPVMAPTPPPTSAPVNGAPAIAPMTAPPAAPIPAPLRARSPGLLPQPDNRETARAAPAKDVIVRIPTSYSKSLAWLCFRSARAVPIWTAG